MDDNRMENSSGVLPSRMENTSGVESIRVENSSGVLSGRVENNSGVLSGRAENNREVLLSRVQICDLVLIETHLFLDTHPDNQEALAYYKKYLDLRKEAADAYVREFGPLKASDYDGGPRWRWVDAPWPWQKPSEVV